MLYKDLVIGNNDFDQWSMCVWYIIFNIVANTWILILLILIINAFNLLRTLWNRLETYKYISNHCVFRALDPLMFAWKCQYFVLSGYDWYGSMESALVVPVAKAKVKKYRLHLYRSLGKDFHTFFNFCHCLPHFATRVCIKLDYVSWPLQISIWGNYFMQTNLSSCRLHTKWCWIIHCT